MDEENDSIESSQIISKPKRYGLSWATRLERGFEIEMAACERCGGKRNSTSVESENQ